MAKDESALFLRRFQDRMPPGKPEEGRARTKVERKHRLYDAEVDEVLYECSQDDLWAWRPQGEAPGGVDLWYVAGRTGAERIIFIVGRMGNDGLFRLVTAHSLTPADSDEQRQLLREYRQQIGQRPGTEEEGEP